jgi:hypothetical protein
MPLQIKPQRTADYYAPSVRVMIRKYPVLRTLVSRLTGGLLQHTYLLQYYNWGQIELANTIVEKNILGEPYIDFGTLDFPTVFDSYYHTIKSDGKNILVELKH